jgi:hypothetical protein
VNVDLGIEIGGGIGVEEEWIWKGVEEWAFSEMVGKGREVDL